MHSKVLDFTSNRLNHRNQQFYYCVIKVLSILTQPVYKKKAFQEVKYQSYPFSNKLLNSKYRKLCVRDKNEM